MPDLASIFGVQSATEPRFMVAEYLIANALFAHTISSTRVLKMIYGIDNHVSPRADLEKFGPRAVLEGRLTQRQLDMLKRNESAHANSMEHFPIFATAMVLAKLAGLPAVDINLAGLLYTGFRIAFCTNYVLSTTMVWARLRPVFWWASNIVCFRLLWRAGKAFNGAF